MNEQVKTERTYSKAMQTDLDNVKLALFADFNTVMEAAPGAVIKVTVEAEFSSESEPVTSVNTTSPAPVDTTPAPAPATAPTETPAPDAAPVA